MQTHIRTDSTVVWISLAALLAGGGCTTTQKADILPQDGPTMRQIYDNHMNNSGDDDTDKARGGLSARTITEEVVVETALTGDIDDAENEVERSIRSGDGVRTKTVTLQRVVKTPQRPASDIHTRAGMAQGDAPPGYARQEANITGYTRTVANEINHRFARLPNPDLVMFVYPHLAGPDSTPIPGYATSVPMYEQVEYAMPGEIHNRRILP